MFYAVYTLPGDPRAIEDLTIYLSSSDVSLEWTPVTEDINGNPITVSHYNIYRGSEGDGSDLTLIGTSSSSTYTDIGVVNDTEKYFYNVRADIP